MTFQSAPECAEAVIRFQFEDIEMVNVLNFLKTGGYDQTAINNLAGVVGSAVVTYYKPYVANVITYLGTLVRGLESQNDLTTFYNTGAGVGGIAGSPTSTELSFVISLRSNFTGRSARGRVYMMPPLATQFSGTNTVTQEYANLMVAAIEQIRAAALTASWVMVVLSRRANRAARPTAVTFPVTSVAARNLLVDSQRGRLPKGH